MKQFVLLAFFAFDVAYGHTGAAQDSIHGKPKKLTYAIDVDGLLYCKRKYGTGDPHFAKCIDHVVPSPEAKKTSGFRKLMTDIACSPDESHDRRERTLRSTSINLRESSSIKGGPANFTVDVLREHPLVVVIRGFATGSECDDMIRESRGSKRKDQVKTSTYQQGSAYGQHSTSLLKESNLITKMVSRKMMLIRNLTSYAVSEAGQEPVSAVIYKNLGDEQRTHCDGSCHEEAYRPGERVATSLLYCHVAREGGETVFPSSGLKVVPSKGDLLFFTYKMNHGRMAGVEVEHGSCPIKQGWKWVATQWYREHVNESWDWQAASKINGRLR